MSEEINRPFPLHGPRNARELGGYMTTDGRRTKEHVFVRADGLDSLTGKDRQFLRRYPVELVIDLRSRFETRLAPDRLDRHFEQMHVPMFDHVQSELARRAAEGYEGGPKGPVYTTLAEIYVLLAETEQEEIYTVLKKLIDTEKPALFHCTAGKDRTGIISMCLLEAAGVPEGTILADYGATAKYLGGAFRASGNDDAPEDAYDSSPRIMQHLRDHLQQKYGSTIGYLHHIGLTDADIGRLRAKFTEPA